MDFKRINSAEEFDQVITENLGVLFFFSTMSCSVGEALEPKIINLLENNFPKIPFYFVDINSMPEIASKNSVFVEPTILVFFEGKESIRNSRNISVNLLSDSISRLYNLAFE
jgi:thiol-disulfide isomerase/thioredoxin